MLSRREWIGRLLTLAGVAGLATRGAAETTTKVTRAAARYQDSPNNMQMCGMCKFYIPPGGACRLWHDGRSNGTWHDGVGDLRTR
jgi:hypothetical protein